MISKLTKEDKIYVNMHVEQVFNSLFLDSSVYALRNGNEDNQLVEQKGIYQRSLTQNTVKKLKDELINTKEKTIQIDMNFIDNIKNNVLIEFLKLLKECYQKKKVIDLCNVNPTVWGAISAEKYDINIKEKYDPDKKNFFVSILTGNEDVQDIEKLRENVKEGALVFEERLQNEIINCKENHDRKSLTSRVKLSIYLNIKEIIKDYSFFCYCVYKLAIKLIDEKLFDKNNIDKNMDKDIFVHTMNSSLIGSIIAQLFCVDIILVDHLGPYNKLYIDDLSKTINKKKKYIVVSDVVCMGTELSNAQSILNVFGANYIGCISFVHVVPVQDADENIYSLYSITKDNNVIDYTITTELCEK